MTPLFDGVAFVAVKVETQSGIIVTTSNNESYGRVIAIGSDVHKIAVEDLIVPNWRETKKASINGEEVFFISESQILAKL